MSDRNTPVNRKNRNTKYGGAASLYAMHLMTYMQIGESSGLGVPVFRVYSYRPCREQAWVRNGASDGAEEMVHLCPRLQDHPMPACHKTYKTVMDVYDHMAYIKYNVSQISSLFSIDVSASADPLNSHCRRGCNGSKKSGRLSG